ncbi:MAG: DNA polymerase III subunit delta' [Symploca sp. SIO1C4]|uniref:DNA polymerase III subunit delta n=1 Tax=Symploca sp. SIO1C4 TaxID=2607765 RepID=A0A6B3N1L2_9CYAN|nr:DNA polymerase III subunit delta' [Symploca sp. SIO1C4]
MVTEAFASLVGQAQAIALLQGAVATNRIAPAYLFVGCPGVGRSLAARAFIELLLLADIPRQEQPSVQKRLQQGNHPDVLWVEPTYLHRGIRLSASELEQKGIQRQGKPQIRLEQIREITRFLSCSPLAASRQVVVLKQAQTMAEAAANSLLKTLEEPGQATLILIAPSIESLLPTLVSRCQQIPFYRLTLPKLETVLRQTGHQEILAHSEILALAQGSPGKAIASFTQLQAMPSELLNQLLVPPQTPRQALELAKEIDKILDLQAQLWLLDYLQQSYWQTQTEPVIIQQLEKAKQYLLNYAQPRLVWEVTLLDLNQALFL